VHVAPAGTAAGNGSAAKPYDLATVFAGRANVQPGDTVLLKAGQYDGPLTTKNNGATERHPFRPKLNGTADKPIVVTSAPGGWAHLNGTMEVDGCAYTHFVRLEIGDLLWDPRRQKHQNGTAFNSTHSESIKLVNCNVFGGAMGTGLWSPARNLVAYGNLIHDFGWHNDKVRGSGHAAYVQNDEGTKTLEHNIAYRGCGWNFDLYTQKGDIKGFDVLENIGYIASWHKPRQVGFNFGLTGWKPAERIRFIGNVGYHSRGPEESWRSNMRLIYSKDATICHIDAVVKDNYLMGTCRALVVCRWKNIEITGNTFWGSDVLTEISSAPAGCAVKESPYEVELAGYTVDNNTYFDNGKPKPFILGNHEDAKDDEKLTFADWQKLGLDKHSKMLPGKDGRPVGIKTFVFPNKYQKGRANVAIFAWDGQPSVKVDLSKALAAGQKYKIYNCLDISQTITRAKPVLAGAFNGQPVAFPMRHNSCSPDFDAFLVLPE
jgi:hypothetical protein